MQGDPPRAARLLGAAEGLRKAINAPVQAADVPDYERVMVAVRAGLDPYAFAAAWKEGRGITLEQAVELALEVPTRPPTDVRTSTHA